MSELVCKGCGSGPSECECPDEPGFHEITLRCGRCGHEYRPPHPLYRGPVQGYEPCPDCGLKGLALRDVDDVTVEVNWHELRILGIWAERWAGQMPEERMSEESQRIVAVITGKLAAQHTDKPGLTMSADIADLRQWAKKEGAGGVEVHGFREDEEANADG